MPFTRTLSRNRFDIPPGPYEARIVAVDEVESKYERRDGTPMTDIRFEFEILDGEHVGTHVRGWTQPFFDTDPECKLHRWVCEILGVDALPTDFELRSDDLLDRPVRIWVQHKPTSGVLRARVVEVMRVVDQPTATPSPHTATDQPFVSDDWDD
jgi:hypothetical protein